MDLIASQLIKLYMQDRILIGSIHYASTPEARLLDTLNEVSDTGPIKRGRFLELTDVTIQHINGTEDKLQVAYINKSTIHLSGNLEEANVGRGIGAQAGTKSYPFVEKFPMPVRLETQSYIVTGNMYHMNQQQIRNVLEETLIFLPITHAQVYSIATSTSEKLTFVAVNKEHILALEEEDSTFTSKKSVESNIPKSSK